MAENIKSKIKEAIKEFDELIKKYPRIEEFYTGRAFLYTQIKEYGKAVKDYQMGCKYMSYDIMAICKRNNLLKELEKIYTRNVNKDKNNIAGYMNRARFYMKIGKDREALADCEIVLKKSPENEFFSELKEILVKRLKEEERKRNKTSKVFLT